MTSYGVRSPEVWRYCLCAEGGLGCAYLKEGGEAMLRLNELVQIAEGPGS